MRTARSLDLVKMHGAGNTFVVLDERPQRFARYDDLARELCAAEGRAGGADGLLVLRDAPGFDAEMRIFNADGSEAEMCGNGARCVVRYLTDRGAADSLAIETLAGRVLAEVVSRSPAFAARVDVGRVTFPRDAAPDTIEALGRAWTFYDVSLGNPHAVIFCDDPETVDLAALGAAFQAHALFPNGTNVHLAHVVDSSTLRVRHFERGVGLTQACGTGAVACAVAAVVVHGARSPIDVDVPGGRLVVAWSLESTARLTGPAETIVALTVEPG